MIGAGSGRRQGRSTPSDASKKRAYRAWGWHLRHAHELERRVAGAGSAYLDQMTEQLEQARRAAEAAVRQAAAGGLTRVTSRSE